MCKELEMGETRVSIQAGGGVKNKLASSPMPSWGPRTHQVPPQMPRESPIILF